MQISIKKVADIIKEFINDKDMSTTRWVELETIGTRKYALVFGWSDGFNDIQKNTGTTRNTCRLCGKIAYNDSHMSEYDIDWIMPIIKETNDVYDTETMIANNMSEIEQTVKWWNDEWKVMKEMIENEKIL